MAEKHGVTRDIQFKPNLSLSPLKWARQYLRQFDLRSKRQAMRLALTTILRQSKNSLFHLTTAPNCMHTDIAHYCAHSCILKVTAHLFVCIAIISTQKPQTSFSVYIYLGYGPPLPAIASTQTRNISVSGHMSSFIGSSLPLIALRQILLASVLLHIRHSFTRVYIFCETRFDERQARRHSRSSLVAAITALYIIIGHSYLYLFRQDE